MAGPCSGEAEAPSPGGAYRKAEEAPWGGACPPVAPFPAPGNLPGLGEVAALRIPSYVVSVALNRAVECAASAPQR